MLKRLRTLIPLIFAAMLSACGGVSTETEESEAASNQDTASNPSTPIETSETPTLPTTDLTDSEEEKEEAEAEIESESEQKQPNTPSTPNPANTPTPSAEEDITPVAEIEEAVSEIEEAVTGSEGPAPQIPQPRVKLPPANTLTLELESPRVFNFSWRPMRGITHYSLFERLSDDDQFEILRDNISPLEINLDLELPLLTRVTASYKLQACTEDGCTDSNIVSMSAVDADLNSAIGQLASDKSDNFDRFGRAVSISGDGLTIAVGSPFDDVLPPRQGFAGDDSGTVTIYKKNSETLKWQEVAYFVSPAGHSSYFGRSLQLDDDGSILAVGANGANSVFIFEKRAETWNHWATVQPPQPESGDNFGYSVAINDQGNRIIVGAHGEDSSASGEHDNDLENSGAAYIFSRSSTGFSWREIAHLKASNADARDEFGWAVDMSGNLGSTVIVGAPREDSNSLGQYSDSERDPSNNDIVNSGAAYIFSVVTTDRVRWEQVSYLKASFPRAGNFFGRSVAIADFKSIVAVGAPGSSRLTKDGNTEAGLVYTYTRKNTAHTLWGFDNIITPLFHEDGDLFGHSLSFSKDGETLAIGAPGESGYASGLHYRSEFSAEEGTGNDESGAAYIFKPGLFLGQKSWNQQVYIRQPSISFGNDNFGFSLAIDNSAESLVVGQPGLQFKGSGQDQGSVFIY